MHWELLGELWDFMKVRKKLWLFPVVVVLVFFIGILIAAQGSVIAPFVYTLF